MKKILLLLCAHLILNSTVLAQQPALISELENVYSSSIVSAEVNNIIIEKEGAKFLLKKGKLFLGKEINGEKYAAAFIGDGKFSFQPTSYLEQSHLKRFFEKEFLEESFENLFLFFADSTVKNILENIQFSPEENISFEKSYSSVISNLLDEANPNIGLIYTLLEEEVDNGYFLAYVNKISGGPFQFEISPYREEEVSFSATQSGYLFKKDFEIISQYQALSIKNLKDGTARINNYNINSTIKNNLDFIASAQIDFTSKADKQKWICFYLFNELEVDSVTWNNKKRIPHYKEEEGSVIWIRPDDPLKISEDYSATIFYHGDLLEKNEFGWIKLKSPGDWFPRNFLREKSNFNLTFHTPAEYKFCAIGVKTSEELDDEEEVQTSNWKTEYPVRNASFNIGLFKKYELKEKDLPAVKVWMSESGHNVIAGYLAPQGILSTSNPGEKIAADVANSFNMFKETFGDIHLKELYVTETPYMHGEAYPGLVHLSWVTYQGIGNSGEDEIFRAHEVAHQWWGINVDFESYHDQWLSEGFSDYSGLWFLQALEGNNEKFFDVLEKWKNKIFDNRNYLFTSGQKAAPIYMGYRTSSSGTEGDYSLIIYKKGAWIIHMLRNMMLDFKTMNEDKFKNMMKDFFNTYSGKKASTKDFKKIVDKHFGEDMGWFFNQWVYGTEIPTYKFDYTTTPTDDGRYKIKCKIVGENISNNFKAYVPLLIVFEGDKFVRLKIEVKGNYTEVDLPSLPLNPEEIIFNDLHSVLCEVD